MSFESWEKVKFADVVEFPPQIKLQKGNSYPFVELSDIDIGFKYVCSKQEKTYDGSGAKFENGDTLFARITPSLENGKIAQVKDLKDKAFGSGEFFIFRGKKDITDSDFIYYLSQTQAFRDHAINSMVGASGRQRADNKFVGRTEFLLPPLSIQKKIAKILSNYDDLIENNLKQIKLLEEKARLIYEEWFEFRTIDGKQISDEKISIVIMEDLLENYMNGGWGKEELDGNYNTKAYVIRGTDIPDISKGNYRTLPLRFHTQSNLSSRNLDIGDISIEMSNGNINNVGRSFYFDRGTKDILNENVMCASFCKMIKPKNINVSYLLDQHLKYIHSTDKMLIYKSQGANGINNFRFEDMINEELIYVPENDLLKELTNKFSTIYDLISTFRMQVKLLNESRDILLPRLMTGMIDVENIDIEV